MQSLTKLQYFHFNSTYFVNYANIIINENRKTFESDHYVNESSMDIKRRGCLSAEKETKLT